MRGYQIAKARTIRGWSQEVLASEIGTTQKQISRWETGKRDVPGEMVVAMADKLGVTVDFILGLTDKPFAETVDMEFGDRVRQLRKKKGWTQEDLANAVGVSRQAISQWEKGWSIPKTQSLANLAHALDCKISDLFDKETEYAEILDPDFGKELGEYLESRGITPDQAVSIFGLYSEEDLDEVIRDGNIEARYISNLRNYFREDTPFDYLFDDGPRLIEPFVQEGRVKVSAEEFQLLEEYRALNDIGQTEARRHMDYLTATEEYRRPTGDSAQVSA